MGRRLLVGRAAGFEAVFSDVVVVTGPLCGSVVDVPFVCCSSIGVSFVAGLDEPQPIAAVLTSLPYKVTDVTAWSTT